jgi:outer membrane protein assembly factor BamB
VPSTLIDLDTAPAAAPRPGHSGFRGRTALAVLSLILIALLGPAARAVPDHLKATLIPARNEDNLFAHGDRLYVVDAAPTGGARRMRTYRLPDGKLLARTDLQIPEAVTGVLPVGDTTLIQTTVGQRPAVMALDNATGLSRWWQFGTVRGASLAAGLVLTSDDSAAQDCTAIDLRTGTYRWQVLAPDGGQLTMTGERDGLPRWLVALGPHGRLDSYDGSTGRHMAGTQATTSGPLSGAADNLFVLGGSRDGVTAYSLPGLTTRWQIWPDGLSRAWLGPDCGALLCVFGPGLMALDPATGRTRWTSDRWSYAQLAGDFLIASDTDGPPDVVPLSVLDPATGQLRADLGGWRRIPGSDDTMTYLVNPGVTTSFFGRLDPARTTVRIIGTTDRVLGQCDEGAGAVACHLTDGPVAIWRLS